MFQRWNSGAVSFGIQESKTMSSRAKEVQCDAMMIQKTFEESQRGSLCRVFKPLTQTTSNKGKVIR